MSTSAFSALVPDPGALQKVFTGGLWLEGPCWLRRQQVLRFSDVKTSTIRDFDPATGETRIYRSNADHVNGRTVDLDGSVLECCHGTRSVLRDRDGVISTVADRIGQARLNAPNDIVVRSDGTVWFTDPAYGLIFPEEGHGGCREYGDHWVLRINLDGTLTVAATDVVEPNGLAFSPDESVLYVADSAAITRAGEGALERRHIRAYHVDGDRLKAGHDIARVPRGVPDGIRVDAQGNIWSSSEDAVVVFSPAGALLGQIPVPEKIGNLCFGGADGSTLFITATSSLYTVATATQDCRWAHGRA